MPLHPTSWRSILILSSHLRLGLNSHVPFPLLRSCQRISSGPRQMYFFLTRLVFKVRSFWHLTQLPSWRTTPWRLSTTAYSIYSQLPSILEAVPPSATWGRAMPWWQEPTYCGLQLKAFENNRKTHMMIVTMPFTNNSSVRDVTAIRLAATYFTSKRSANLHAAISLW